MYEFWISIASLILSIVAVSWNIKLQKESNDLQKRIVLIEEEREYERKVKSRQANLRVELRKDEKGYEFCIINYGEAEARNIQVKINGMLLKEWSNPIKAGRNGMGILGSLPPYISPNSRVEYYLIALPDYISLLSFPFEVEIKWDDDYEKDRIYFIHSA